MFIQYFRFKFNTLGIFCYLNEKIPCFFLGPYIIDNVNAVYLDQHF